jgi:hypothetical protein
LRQNFYASTLIAANLNPKVIQARLGHCHRHRHRHRHRDDGYPRAPLPDAEDLGRGAIDAIFAMPLTEQGRNQESR